MQILKTVMKKGVYSVKSEVVLYPGMSGWHFAYVDKKKSKEIREKYATLKKGWGSIPVTVTLGKTTWNTSIFPDKKSETYLLPLKAEVRKKEHIVAKKKIMFSIVIEV